MAAGAWASTRPTTATPQPLKTSKTSTTGPSQPNLRNVDKAFLLTGRGGAVDSQLIVTEWKRATGEELKVDSLDTTARREAKQNGGLIETEGFRLVDTSQ